MRRHASYHFPETAIKGRIKRSRGQMKKWVTVNDRMQKGYRYELSAPAGRSFDPEFKPELTPAEMLALGVFCGKYMTDTRKEFPNSWFKMTCPPVFLPLISWVHGLEMDHAAQPFH